MDALRIVHANRLASYGAGTFVCLLPEPGQARATFDGDAGTPRRVLVRDLTPETTLAARVAASDRSIADMMGHDGRAVTRCLRESVA